ncbi:unnamed protein product [Aureobasidium mustum]|uniref:Uncharacterized protein n=1 Tax=Aureobasidium mustum TaxID=2773714 RepID=A0A9N8P834_9PEZI|nr:unnamed protein product [Aureobasidium mustum]
MCNRNLSPDFWNVKAATFVDLAALDDGMAFKKTRTNNQRNTTRSRFQSRFQSTTGIVTLKAQNLRELRPRNENHTCADIEVPHINSSVPTAHSVGSNSAEESDMESVDISSEDESDDGWSVISDDSDFVVVDSAETIHRSSKTKSKRRPSLPRRVSKVQAKLSTASVHQENMMASENDREELKLEPAVDDNSQDIVDDTQRLAAPKPSGNTIDVLIERLTKQARALSLE